MHRHTTNSISTASAVFSALQKLISRKEGRGTKRGLKYQLPLMGEKEKKLMDATFPEIHCYSINFSLIYIFYNRAITAYDDEILIPIGLI